MYKSHGEYNGFEGVCNAKNLHIEDHDRNKAMTIDQRQFWSGKQGFLLK
jgi:hypothetical protein